jgi:hypothetical protein
MVLPPVSVALRPSKEIRPPWSAAYRLASHHRLRASRCCRYRPCRRHSGRAHSEPQLMEQPLPPSAADGVAGALPFARRGSKTVRMAASKTALSPSCDGCGSGKVTQARHTISACEAGDVGREGGERGGRIGRSACLSACLLRLCAATTHETICLQVSRSAQRLSPSGGTAGADAQSRCADLCERRAFKIFGCLDFRGKCGALGGRHVFAAVARLRLRRVAPAVELGAHEDDWRVRLSSGAGGADTQRRARRQRRDMSGDERANVGRAREPRRTTRTRAQMRAADSALLDSSVASQRAHAHSRICARACAHPLRLAARAASRRPGLARTWYWRSSGAHFSATLSSDARLSSEKATRKTSVCLYESGRSLS